MYKTKLFGGGASEDWYRGTESINKWLEENSNITIVSVNTVANVAGWGYIILYKEGEAHE